MLLSGKEDQDKHNYRPIKLLITIVDRGVGKRVVEICDSLDVKYHLTFMGRGTAKSDILDYFGLAETQKDIIFSVVLEDKVRRVLRTLTSELELDHPGNGIAFTVPIVSVGGPLTLQLISGLYDMLLDYAKRGGNRLGKQAENH